MMRLSGAAALSVLALAACSEGVETGAGLSGKTIKASFGGAPPAELEADTCRPEALSLTHLGRGEFAFVNDGAAICTLQGFPTVLPLKAGDGHPLFELAQRKDRSEAPRQVPLQPGGQGRFVLDFAGRGKPCVKTARLQAAMPGDRSRTFEIEAPMTICGGQLVLSPIRSGA